MKVRYGGATAALAGMLCLLILLTGCNELKNARPITDVDHLEGQRVAVALAWGPDYLLTGREDLTLVRYNTVADMVTALCYQRVDALAVEDVLVSHIMSAVKGVSRVEQPITTDWIAAIFSTEQEALMLQFNEFVAQFRGSPEYEELLVRSKSEDGYQFRPVEVPPGGRTIRVGVADDNYPFSYLNMVTGKHEGIDIEVASLFAAACGYEVEFCGGSWTSMELGVHYHQYDMGVSGVSDLYRQDYEYGGFSLMSDVYFPVDIVFIEVEDREELAIVAALDEE